jgi:hypothetical protein
MLLIYKRWRQTPPSLPALLKPALPRLLLGVALTAATLAFVSLELGLFLGGMFAGAALRHASIMRQVRRTVPFLIEVIDWEKADRLLAETSPAPGGAPPASPA